MSGQAYDIKSNLRFINYVVNEIRFKYNDQFKMESVKIDFNIMSKTIVLLLPWM